jgi:cell division transport system permease protein
MTRLLWLLREAWRGLWFNRGTTWAALVTAIGSFLVLGVFLLFTANVQHALAGLGDRREVVIYLRDSAPEAQKDSLLAKLNAVYGTATYVSREQAWNDFSEQLGGSDLLEAVEQNPLPASIRLKLRPEFENFESTERVADIVAGVPIVETVRFGGDWVRRLDEFVATLRHVDLVVGLVVALCVLFVVANTIRLTLAARAETLRILALVGAGNGFIFTPLVLEGVIAAVIGAVIALGIVYGGATYLDGKPVPLVQLPWTWMGQFVGAAAGLGLLGALVALVPLTRKH